MSSELHVDFCESLLSQPYKISEICETDPKIESVFILTEEWF